MTDETKIADFEDQDFLDREHQRRVSRVASCDSTSDRQEAAEAEMGLLTEEEQYLSAERNALGGDEHVEAILRSGWYPYSRQIRASARLLWLLDAALWLALWASIWWMWKTVISNG